MTTELNHEQRAQLIEDALDGIYDRSLPSGLYLFGNRLAQAAYTKGADDELDACIDWVEETEGVGFVLREKRRPPVLTVKEEIEAVVHQLQVGQSLDLSTLVELRALVGKLEDD